MTREELKAHCLDQIEMCKTWAVGKGEEPSGKIYEEHKLILELLEQEPRWIPCSERLPERSGEYLVSVIDGSGDDIDYEAVGVAWFAHKKDYDIKESEWRELGIDEVVIAWMSLPKPYKTESEDKE